MKIVKMMYEAGAKEVHMRISSPPITHPDFYGIDTPKRETLFKGLKSIAYSQDGTSIIGGSSWLG